MNNEILDSIEKPRVFFKEHTTYRYFVGFIWLLLGAKLSYEGLHNLHLYSESMKSGLLVLFDPTPSLWSCFEPITLGILCFTVGFSVLKNSKNRPKLLLLYLSTYTIFCAQYYALSGALLPLIPFLAVLKFKLSFKESALALFSSFGLGVLVWIVQDKSLNYLIELLITPDTVLLIILNMLSFWKYSSAINSLFEIRITATNRLFLLISATPWILSFLCNILGLNQGTKFF